ncbi:MAG: DNA topoisomerase 3 [Firmicutes bacterium]|nr:DNA topoisomerase 3 [Bacillota bacterium]MBT9165800.1 DNA topoisomerase 3 [Chloroflexota bacterium]
MRLFIAEKPSLARAIAEGLGKITDKSDSHIAVGDDVITWCYGHILELAPPEAYDASLSRWTLESLPISIPADGWKLLVKGDAKAQFSAIGKLLKRAGSVVNAGDPDREGQMLVDEVLDAHHWRGRTDRVLVSNATVEGVRAALRKIESNTKYRPLYEAAKCRSRADWLVGMNLTRAATKRIGPVTSIGRVQTPTLALIVQRDLVIEGHASSNYYPLHAHVQTEQGTFVAVHDPAKSRITDIKVAREIEAALTQSTVILTTAKGQEKQGAPLPFMLSSFQSAAEQAYGWGAKESLQVLQQLYEAKLTTYPRTDCPYLPEEHAAGARKLANTIIESELVPIVKPAMLAYMAPRSFVYDDKKVVEHHGIVPTNKIPPATIAPKLRDGWILVARRFLQSLLPALINDVMEVSFTHDERKFSAKRLDPQNLEESWLSIEPPKELRAENTLSFTKPVSKGLVLKVVIKTAKTSPPKRYTESTLIDDMKAVGKFVDDARLKAILKETSGIGTAATHASIIETLKQRGYVSLVGKGKIKNIMSTPFGRYLISSLPRELRDPGLTALWEEQLNIIARGESSPDQFMRKIESYVAKYVSYLKDADFGPLPEGSPVQNGAKGFVKKQAEKSESKLKSKFRRSA